MRIFIKFALSKCKLHFIRFCLYLLVVESTYISIKKEMANFGYDDDVLLKMGNNWHRRCVGSYSHFQWHDEMINEG